MKTILITSIAILFLVGCTAQHNPYANIGASKTINVGGIDVGVGIHDIIRLGQ
jgi:PBP1b-binding outer membrane lipoprotein LpoB